MALFPSVLKEEYSSVILNWRSIMKTSNDLFVTVKEAALLLSIRKGQIRDLISKKRIDYKLQNGTYVVDIDSIEKSVLKDLKDGNYIHPKVIAPKAVKSKKQPILRNDVIDNVINGFKTEKLESYLKDKYDLYKSYCDANSINFDGSIHQFIVQFIINEYHCLDMDKVGLPISYFGDYSFIFVKEMKGMKDGFYFIDKPTILAMNFAKLAAAIEFGKETTYEIYNDLHCLYLTIDEFISEFSPKTFYTQNLLWSQFLAVCSEPKETVISRKSHTNSTHTVKGFYRKQPYGSRKNPKYKTIWINDFDRGGSKIKEAA